MSVSPLSPPAAPASESYFAQPSTRWDVIKFLVPFLLGAGGLLTNAYYTQQSQGQEITQQAARIAAFQDAKESRGERLIVVETKVGNIGTQVDKLETKIDRILERIPAPERIPTK